MASADQALIRIVGRGGQGAAPHEAVDPVLASASLITVMAEPEGAPLGYRVSPHL